MKNFISLFLIFSLMMLSANLCAKERRGATLIITKKDGQQIQGELITVKPNSLLLLNTEGKDVSVDIEEIKVIRIVKKSKILKGASIGLLIGGGGGALTGLIVHKGREDISLLGYAFIGLIYGGSIGLLVGGIHGASAGKDKTIQIEGMTDSELHAVMDKLRKRARIRDYK